ncbi:hypothetical protein [Paraburkholderia kururiensis]|nr:hypothetical protein [Paraburkholderia kururiensis]
MEFTANVKTARGTESVTVRASSKEAAILKLLRLGYLAVNWIL